MLSCLLSTLPLLKSRVDINFYHHFHTISEARGCCYIYLYENKDYILKKISIIHVFFIILKQTFKTRKNPFHMNQNRRKKACLTGRQALIIIIFMVTYTASFAQNSNTADSLKNLLKTANKNEKAKLLNELAKAYLPNFPQKAKKNAMLALQLAKKQNNRKEEALEYYQKSLKIIEEFKDKKGIAYSFINIGVVYKKLNNYDDALEYYQKSLKILEEIKDKKGIAYSLNNIGNIYKELSNYEDALEYYQKSLKIKEEIKDKRGIAYSLNNIGDTYKELNNYEDALEYYQKSLKIKEEIKNKRGIAYSLNNIGELYNKLGKFNKALLYFGKSLEIAESLNTKDIIIDSYELYSESYSAMGNYKKAFEYYKQYTALKDSVFSLKTHKQISDMKNKYETEKKDKQIQTLKYENNIKTIKIKHHKKTHIIYITVLILTCAAIAIILIQYRKKNTAYKFLVSKNLDLLSKEKELKIFKGKNFFRDKNGQSIVSDDEKEKILGKLENMFDTDKIFTQHDLTINKLSKKLSTNRNYLSWVIKNEFGKNYSDFINEYRVKEAMFLLSDSIKNRILSIEAIGEEAGFKTRSSFYLAFKKYAGITPSKFKDNINGL